ncbi:MAG: ribonuclease J [Clostridia bacterium]|nr:ribonuclease J [Clostridia bacterium]
MTGTKNIKRGSSSPKATAKNGVLSNSKKTNKPKASSKATFSSGSRAVNRPKNKKNTVKKPSFEVAFLGGLNEIGKNITLIKCNDDMFILDCGMAFPDVEMPGVDLVIPDFSYIEKNYDRIKGLVITHGHEDHIGSIPYLLRSVNVPIYGTALTIGLLSGKLKEHNLLNKAKLNVVKVGSKISLGCMEVEFIHVNHSIPDAVGLAIRSPAGTLVHTGDFKVDFTPVHGEVIDLGRFAQLGNEGVLALFADSTNADRPGYTKTEKNLNESFEALFRKAEHKRIIIASFASNIGRIKQIIECAIKYKRKVAFSGRSMLNYVTIASELGYMNVPEGVIISIDLLTKYTKEQVVLLTTGSQGEPMSALSRMASADHSKVEVGPEDFIIISANPIPGNEKMISSVVNDLMKRGCTVVYESMYETHVSGHACAEELKLIQSLVRPKYFIPVHGEQKHLKHHRDLAKEMGMKESNIYIGDIGDLLEINENYMKNIGTVPAGKVLVDGLGVGDVGNVVLRDRKKLAEDGLIIVVCTIDFSNGTVISGPDIVSRGFVYVRESEDLMDQAKKIVSYVLKECNRENIREWSFIKIKIKEKLSNLFYEQTKRKPMILPIIMEV